MAKKVGRLSRQEREEIRRQSEVLPPAEVASRLGRSEEVVREVLGEVKRGKAWELLQEELTEDEYAYFEERYSTLVNQFRGDVLPTEETQIFQLIKCEILMSRNMVYKRRALLDVRRLEGMVARLEGIEGEVEVGEVLGVERLLQAAREGEQARTSEYLSLQKEHNALMKTLKATRDQRIDKVESGRDTFVGLVRRLQDEEYRKVEGRRIEMLRLANQRERARLSQPMEYADGMHDRPLLTPESVETAVLPKFADPPESCSATDPENPPAR